MIKPIDPEQVKDIPQLIAAVNVLIHEHNALVCYTHMMWAVDAGHTQGVQSWGARWGKFQSSSEDFLWEQDPNTGLVHRTPPIEFHFERRPTPPREITWWDRILGYLGRFDPKPRPRKKGGER